MLNRCLAALDFVFVAILLAIASIFVTPAGRRTLVTYARNSLCKRPAL